MSAPLPDLTSLECFVAAAELLHFRRAAHRVALTPTALGQRIKALEDLLGVPLFHRTTRRVALTEAGVALLPQARATLQAAADCASAARRDAGPSPVSLVLGTRHELGLSWVLPLLPTLETALPHLTVHLSFGSGPELSRGVLSGELDCAISSLRSVSPGLDHHVLHREDYLLVAAPDALARAPIATLDHLSAHTLVDIGPALPLYSYWVAGLGSQPRPALAGTRWMGTLDAIRAWVVDGRGVAVLPAYRIAADLAAGRLVRVLPEIDAQHDFFRLWHRRGDPRGPLLESVAEVLRAAPLR